MLRSLLIAWVKNLRIIFNKARLYEYQIKKDLGTSQDDLKRLIKSLQQMHHPTVWAEMKRQYTLHEELKSLFKALPEALKW